jgi:PAS domain-containing protein
MDNEGPSSATKTGALPCCPAKDGDALFHAVVEAALDAIVVIDRRGTIRSANKASEQMFGYAVEELNQRLTAAMNYLEAARHLTISVEKDGDAG